MIKTLLVGATIQLVAPADKGWAVNKEGPWHLQISNVENLKLKKLSMPGYVLTFEELKTSSFSYKMEAYYCTPNHSLCERKVFSGKVLTDHGKLLK
jgi:hypothetical protein